MSDQPTVSTRSLPAVDVPELRDERQGEGEQLQQELRKRGVINPASLLIAGELDAVAGAIRWYDEQPREGANAVGPGLLTNVIRDGGMPGYGEPTVQPAPCTRTPALEERWRQVTAALEAMLPGDPFVGNVLAWASLLHPHSWDGVTGWTLGAEAWVLDYIGEKGRLGRIRKAAGCPVHVVSCDPAIGAAP